MDTGIIDLLLLGAIFMQMLFLFAFSFFFNKKALISFFIFTISSLFFAILLVYPGMIGNLNDHNIHISPNLKNVFVFFGNGFLYLFVFFHLDRTESSRLFEKVISITAYTLIFTGLILLLYVSIDQLSIQLIRFCYVVYFLNILVQLYLIINLILRKDVHARLIAVGFLLMFIIVKLSMLTQMGNFAKDIYKIRVFVMLGINVQLVFFTFSLLYKFWRDDKEKRVLIFQQQQDLLSQRLEISNDLHDNLGSTLSSLNIYSGIAIANIEKNPMIAKFNLLKISKVTQKVMHQINDVVWSISPIETNVSLLSTRLKDSFVDVFDLSEIKCIYKVDEETESMITGVLARKNMLLIAKEAINNAVKYSQADLLHFTLKSQHEKLVLSIEDNGLGIGEVDFKKGKGLSSMKSRCEKLNGFFSIRNIQPSGTLVECVFPITSIRV